MKNQTRRDFILNSGKLLGSGFVLGSLPFGKVWAAGAPKNPLFLHVLCTGGMHSLVGVNPLLISNLTSRNLDPVPTGNDKEFYPTYRDDQLIKAGNHLLGPGAKPLAAVAGDISIVNGVMMLADAPIHETNQAFMHTGDENLREAIFEAVMQQQFDASLFGLAISGSVVGDNGGRTIPLQSLQSGADQLGQADLLMAHARATGQSSTLEKTKAQFAQIKDYFSVYQDVQGKMRARGSQSDLVNIVLPAFKGNLVNYAAITIGNYAFDTHSNHDQGQKSAQVSSWQEVVDLINAAKAIPDGSGSLFDRMVIMVTTEFARSSGLEGPDGTGHNPHNNSVVLSGGLIKTGVNVGQSTVIPSARLGTGADSGLISRLQALPFNYDKNSALGYEDGLRFDLSLGDRVATADGQYRTDYIYPGNILKTVAQALGLQPSHKLNRFNTLQPLIKGG